ncbi:DNRLRE domain-containing protein [Actinoplanes sp. NPDC051494]|uniref:CBM96 family carbohydrate-binding protein n=1 Tax=Actinoplanes sp. NPDC051494 TaxID=3363907 RepID=UPI003789B015
MRRSKLKISVTALAALAAGAGATMAGASAAAAAGSELQLAASGDTYVSSGRKDASFGAEAKLSVGREDRDVKLGFLRFVVPAGTPVTGARLKLVTVGDVAGKLTLNRVAGTDWSESSLTSSNAPELGDVVDSATPGADAAEVTFDVSKAVTGPGTYAFALRSDASSITRFRSTESGTGPVLLVGTSTEVPDMPAEDIPPAIEDEDMPPPPPPATGTATGGECVTGKLLVPSCGVLWGAAAGGFTDAPRDAALKNWEKLSGRTASIFHTYHKGDEPFPTKSEMAMARDAAKPRVLLLNWKIAYGSSWAKVAQGDQDARIDKFAARIKSSFPEKFFLALNHEPENDVKPGKGSGWEARDFAAMYRHTIERLRAKGVTNAINVMAYMGNEKWMAQSWWKDLYPGDDVVDWMGLDSYVSAEKGYYHYGAFGDLLDRSAPGGQGFYDWAASKHAAKPIMVAEWGVYHRVGRTADKSAGYQSVLPELKKRPNIKAVVYFDTKRDDQGDRDISIDSTKTALSAFRTLAADKIFDVKIR